MMGENNSLFGIYVKALLAKNSATQLQKELNKIKDLSVKITPSFGKINKSELSKVNKELKTQLQDKFKEMSKVNIKPEVDKEALNDAGKSIGKLSDNLDKELKPALEETKEKFNLFENMANKTTSTVNSLLGIVGKVAIWGVATNAIYGTKRALKEMMDTYVELESKLIAIERVTNNFDMKAVFDGAYKSSQKYGASLNDMLDSTEEIARSYGDLNEQQVLAAAEAGILASTIAEMDGKEAVGAIIAVSNAYGFAIENGEKLIDMANEVDNNFSVTAANIAKAWEKSSATAKTFGVDIQNLTGYIAAISTVTQESGEVIGNGLKTIFSRITTMDSAINAISKTGVDVFDKTTGQVRKVQDILEDLAGTWDTLSDAQQQNIGVQVAGRYQLTRFLALMNNWSIATKATETALNSEGSAARENQKYLESYAAKMEQLNNARENLANTINGGRIAGLGKTILDIRIGLVGLADAFFHVADASTFLVGSMASLVVFLSKTENGYKTLLNVLKFVTTEEKASAIATSIKEKGLIKNRIALLLAAVAEKKKAQATMLATAAEAAATTGHKARATALGIEAKAATAAAGATSLLSKALLTIPGMAFVAAIALIAKGIFSIVNASKEANKALEEETNTVVANKEEITGYVKKLEKLVKLRKELSKADYKAQYGEDEQKMLDALAEKYTRISDELKDQNHSLEYKLDLMNKEDKAQAKKAKEAYDKKKRETISDPVGIDIEHDTRKYVDRKLNFGDGLNNFFTGQRNHIVSLVDLREKYDDLISSEQKYAKLVGDITSEENDYITILKEKGLANAKNKAQMNEVVEIVEKLEKEYKKAGNQGVKPFIKGLKEIGYSEKEIKELIGDTNVMVEDSANYWTEYKNVLKEASDGISEFNENLRDGTETFFGVAEGYDEAIQSFNEYVNLFGTSNSMVKGMADDLANSFTFLGEKIFQNGEELLNNRDKLNMIRETLAIAKTDTEAYSKAVADGTLYVAKGYKAEWEAVRNAKVAELTTEKEALENKIKIWQAVIDGKKTLAEADAELAKIEGTNTKNKVKTLKDHWNNFKEWVKGVVTGYKAVKSASEGDNKTAQKNLNALKARLNDVNVSIAQWSNFKIVETTANDFKKLTSASEDAADRSKKAYEAAENALRSYANQVEAIDNELKILQEQQKRNIEGSAAWFSNYEAQEKVVRKYQAAINTYIAQIQLQLRNQALDEESKTKLMNKIQDLRLEYEKLNTTVHENIEAQKKFYKGEIEHRLDKAKSLEDTRHDEALKHIKKEREAFKKQIDEQLALIKKAKAARSYEQDLKELQEKRLDILNQISRLEGDDSRLAKSKLKDLYDDLADVEKDLSDLNFDRNMELREDALDDLGDKMEEHYDRMEEIENAKHEAITDSIESTKKSLDDLIWTLEGLKTELTNWDRNLAGFEHWTKGFDALVNTIPSQQVVSTSVPITTYDKEGNPVVTEITFNITGDGSEATDIATEVVNKLKQAGVIVNKN